MGALHFSGRGSGYGAGVGDGLKENKTEDDFRKADNAERDLHRTFQRNGLSLPIPIRTLDHTLPDGKRISIEYVRPSDWLSLLIRRYPELLAGGSAKLDDQLRGFWEHYRFQHPTHAVFSQHGDNNLHNIFPIQFWGDEGRGPKRAGYMAGTIESCLGLGELDCECRCGCAERLQEFSSAWKPKCSESLAEETQSMEAVGLISTNYKGHSFLTRYLLFGIPGYLYSNKADLVIAHLEETARDLVSLFTDGIVIGNRRYFASLVGSKGDLKFQANVVAHLTRSYQNQGTTNARACCSLCMAGTPEYPVEDCSHEPKWAESMFSERPWDEGDEPPPFLKVPFDVEKPEMLYRMDMFHCFKVGVGRDIAASGLVWLCRLGMFDLEGEPKNVPSRLARCHSWFTLWCRAESKTPALRSFTKTFFNYPKQWSSPWANSKGSDTMLLLQFLKWFLSCRLDHVEEAWAAHESMLRLLLRVVTHGIDMADIGYKHPLWMPRECATRLYCTIMVVVRGYKHLAKHFVDHRMAGFRIKPKLHALHHCAYEIRTALHTRAPKILNWVCFACEMNEDHIGHTARMSRKLATKTLGKRLMQRYFLKTKALIRRHFAKRKCKTWDWGHSRNIQIDTQKFLCEPELHWILCVILSTVSILGPLAYSW